MAEAVRAAVLAIYRDGFRAGRAGDSRMNNPHPDKTLPSDAWDAGWMLASQRNYNANQREEIDSLRFENSCLFQQLRAAKVEERDMLAGKFLFDVEYRRHLDGVPQPQLLVESVEVWSDDREAAYAEALRIASKKVADDLDYNSVVVTCILSGDASR